MPARLAANKIYTMQEEKEALEHALAYETGILMSDQVVKREPNLHRRTSYAAATDQPKKKRRKNSKIPPWDRAKKKKPKVKPQPELKLKEDRRQGSLTPLADLEGELDEDIEGEDDEGEEADDTVVVVSAKSSSQDKGKTRADTRKGQGRDNKNTHAARQASPTSLSSSSSIHEGSSRPDASTSSSASRFPTSKLPKTQLQLRPPGQQIPTSTQNLSYPSPSTSVDHEAGSASSPPFPESLATYSSIFKAAGIPNAQRLWQLVPLAHAERFVCDCLAKACKGSLTVDRQFRMLQEIKRHCPRSARPLGLEPFWAFLRTAGVSDARQLMESIRQGGGDVKLYLDFLAQHHPQKLTLGERFALQMATEEALGRM